MAITYSLALACPVPADQVAGELHAVGRRLGVLDESTTPAALLDGATSGLGTWIRVTEAKSRPWDPVRNDLGFAPTVSVAFRLDKEGEVDYQQDDIARVVSGLFERVPGDAVLHREFEDIWLLRRDGELTLNEQDDLWPAHRRAALSQPYRRATHTFAES